MLRFSNRCRKRLLDPGVGLTEAIKVKDKVIRVTRFASEELDELELTIYRQLQKEVSEGIRDTPAWSTDPSKGKDRIS
jgi:hypothetical protein